MTDILALADLPRFDIDPVRGFLPPVDPLTRLPARYQAWDEIGDRVSELLSSRQFRAAIDRMPLLDPTELGEGPEQARAMLLLTIFANGYVWESAPPALRLPRTLGQPLHWLATRLDRPPIAAHASLVLANFRRLDSKGPLDLGNLETLVTFGGIEDESWFYLVTVAIEARGAGAIPDFLAGLEAVVAADVGRLTGVLERIGTSIAAVTTIFERMPEHCAPARFFQRVRPWLAGWQDQGVIYEGGSPEPLRLAGGSAAQSALIQAYDASLGVTHPSPSSGPFLREMRRYMLPGHRRFLEYLDQAPSIARFVAERAASAPALVAAYHGAIDELDRFRKSHLVVAGRYITAESKGDPNAKGTGGTDYGAFLGAARRETQDAKRGTTSTNGMDPLRHP